MSRLPQVADRITLAQQHLADLAADSPERGAALIALARELMHRQPEPATEVAEQAEAWALANHDESVRFEALWIVAIAQLSQSAFARAEAAMAEIKAMATTKAREARWTSLGAIRAQRSGDIKTALRLTVDALRLWDESDEPRSLRAATTHNLAGNLLTKFADFAGAVHHYHEALSLYEDDPDDDVTAIIANNLGRSHRELGQYAEAEAIFGRAIARFADDDTAFVHVALLCNLGQTQVEAGRPADALPYLRRALEICGAGGHIRIIGSCHHTLGMALHGSGALQEACTHFEAALQVRERLGEKLDLCETQVRYAGLLVDMGRAEDAVAILTPLLDSPTATEWLRIRMDGLHLLYRIARERGEWERALDLHVAFHEQSRAFFDERATLRYQAMQVRYQVEQLAREREGERTRRVQNEMLAMTDPLTGLPNRRTVDQLLDQAVEAGKPFAVALLDLDHFKQVNDRFSHAVGDAVLCAFATLVQERLRAGDVIGRYGGEEFVVVFNGCGLDAGLAASERLLKAVRGHDWSKVHPGLHVTASLGLAGSANHRSRATVLAAADAALYRAKAAGRNRVMSEQPVSAGETGAALSE